MKTTSVNILLVIGLVLAIACNNKSSEKNYVDPMPAAQLPLDSISQVLCGLSTARSNIRSYDSICKVLGDSATQIKAYTIRAVDLLGALGMPGNLADSSVCKYKHIRVYIGYRPKVGFKLFIVPVDSAQLSRNNNTPSIAGTDVILDSLGKCYKGHHHGSKGLLTAYDNQYVLDLNAPCPNTCDVTTPLEE